MAIRVTRRADVFGARTGLCNAGNAYCKHKEDDGQISHNLLLFCCNKARGVQDVIQGQAYAVSGQNIMRINPLYLDARDQGLGPVSLAPDP